jgi:hypothetical protein
MPAFELVNLRTNSTTLLPLDAITNGDLRVLANTLSVWQTTTRGFMKITRIF